VNSDPITDPPSVTEEVSPVQFQGSSADGWFADSKPGSESRPASAELALAGAPIHSPAAVTMARTRGRITGGFLSP
jgi:hypothetical protein